MEEAVKEKVSFEEVLYTQRIEDTDRGIAVLAALGKGRAPLYPVSEKVMQSVAETESPQGILGVIRHLVWDIKDVTKGRGAVVIACGLQDPGNLGTIIRTADAGEVSGVITTESTVDIYNPKVIRATMGSIFRVPVLKVRDIMDLISDLKKEGYQIIATTAHSKASYLDIDYMKPTAFLIGQEGSGLPDDIIKMADIKVFIPMKEGVESLNAAVSASILIYEAFRQRLTQHP